VQLTRGDETKTIATRSCRNAQKPGQESTNSHLSLWLRPALDSEAEQFAPEGLTRSKPAPCEHWQAEANDLHFHGLLVVLRKASGDDKGEPTWASRMDA
jgi:hypothetical protein